MATASVDDAGQVTYEFDMDGTADWQWTAAELRELEPGTEMLHFGSIAAWTPPGAERIADLVGELGARGTVLISYDPNVRPTVIGAREAGSSSWSGACGSRTSSRRAARTSNGSTRSFQSDEVAAAGAGSARRSSS